MNSNEIENSNDFGRHKIIFIVGPTASGKTELAIKIAQKYKGVIFNCDSVQLYSKIQIGAAKPSFDEMKLVPHHLFSVVGPPNEFTAGDYSRLFFQTLKSLPSDKPVIVVGGTGFYFQAIEKGMYPLEELSPEIREKVEEELKTQVGRDNLYAELKSADPQYAQKISINDSYRLARAIEIIRGHKKTVTEVQSEFSNKKLLNPLKIGVHWESDELRKRISNRVDKMISDGLVDEVKDLLSLNLEDWAPLKSVGYKETIDYLKSDINLSKSSSGDGSSTGNENGSGSLKPKSDELKLVELKQLITMHTAQLAKKQKTWFQRDKEIIWIEGKQMDVDLKEILEDKIDKYLKGN